VHIAVVAGNRSASSTRPLVNSSARFGAPTGSPALAVSAARRRTASVNPLLPL
jgi:hypothetical protein